MWTSAVMTLCCLQSPGADAAIRLFQAYPVHRNTRQLVRSPSEKQAVILVHGLDLRDDGSSPRQPRFKPWQGSTSTFVKAVSKHADVYALCYAQTTYTENIACFSGLNHTVARIKNLGYQRIVLLGFSAGALVARHFVEEHPKSGVRLVIQVAAPNGGVKIADWGVKLHQVPDLQRSFVQSMGYEYRQALLAGRKHKPIPGEVEFVVVVVRKTRRSDGDGVISCKSQWSRDLQLQNIPYVLAQAKHEEAMYHDYSVATIAGLLERSHPRWSRAKVFQMRRRLGLLP